MSFFKDFKEDLSQAVNELVPGGEENLTEELEDDSDMVVNTLESELDVESELSKLDGLLEKVTMDSKQVKPEAKPAAEAVTTSVEEKNTLNEGAGNAQEDKVMSEVTNVAFEENQNKQAAAAQAATQMAAQAMPAMGDVSDEVAVITAGTSITGNMASTGSLDIRGTINGDVQCNGKLEVTGTINGNSSSSEFFADAAKVEGEVVSTGTVKIGLGSVVIGNITATSAVIAGAIKGDIDVQGPVVVDTSAVIMGNIKSRSVQINNGAVIEGFCSQCYAEIDVESLFAEK